MDTYELELTLTDGGTPAHLVIVNALITVVDVAEAPRAAGVAFAYFRMWLPDTSCPIMAVIPKTVTVRIRPVPGFILAGSPLCSMTSARGCSVLSWKCTRICRCSPDSALPLRSGCTLSPISSSVRQSVGRCLLPLGTAVGHGLSSRHGLASWVGIISLNHGLA